VVEIRMVKYHIILDEITRIVDPDPYWIRINWVTGSGSVIGIRIQEFNIADIFF
jgi:hypothetical protein